MADAFDLDTPAVYIDLDILERNLRRMQESARAMKVALRPHTKTHKIPEIARMQLAGGAVGITVAKVGEAEIMPGDDVLVAYPLLGPKVERLRALSRTRRVMAVVDSVEGARGLGDLPALVEVDVGFGRCGAQSPADALTVAKACAGLRGVFYYPAGLDEAGVRRAAGIVRETVSLMKSAGLRVEVVSGGSTPNAARTPLIPETTEIRPGTYALNDASVVALGGAKPADCALRVLATVVSTAVPGQCVIDAGSKTFSQNPVKVVGGFGLFVDRPWTFEKMNEEHGYVKGGGAAKVGEKVWLIPAHAGTCVNMHDAIAYGRGGRVEGTWTVAARGRVR